MLSAGRTDIAVWFRKIYSPPEATLAGMPVNAKAISMMMGIKMDLMPLPSSRISGEAGCRDHV